MASKAERAAQLITVGEHFDTRRYEAASQLSARQWFDALRIRLAARDELQGHCDSDTNCSQFVLRLLADPLAKQLESSFYLEDNQFSSVTDIAAIDAHYLANSLNETGMEDVLAVCVENARWRSDNAAAMDPEIDDEQARAESNRHCDSDLELLYRSLFSLRRDRGLGPTNELWDLHGTFDSIVRVNLNSPDSHLISDFTAWLRVKRELPEFSQRSKLVSKIEFRNWADLRVLAYIDLELLQLSLCMNLTQPQIGSLLFPDELDVGLPERIRKTLKPLARQLMSHSMLYLLYCQASQQAEQ
jgi:uncharacterized protein DUF6387